MSMQTPTQKRADSLQVAVNRRSVFAGALAATIAAPIPAGAVVPADQAVRAILDELESFQGWETTTVVLTKCYIAYRLRQALGMNLPDPGNARDHLYCQKGSYDAYTHTIWFERDLAAGKAFVPPPPPHDVIWG